MRNHDFDAFSKKIYFWQENGRGRHTDAKGSGPSRADQKGKPLSNKNVFKIQGLNFPSTSQFRVLEIKGALKLGWKSLFWDKLEN